MPDFDPDSLISRIGGRWAGDDLQSTFQGEVAQLLKRGQRSFPGAQPVSFASRHIGELKQQDYYVCEKTDGIRYLMYMTKDGDADIHYLIDRKNDYYWVPGLHFPHHEDKTFNRFHSETILDGELVEDKYPDRPSVIKYLVFDCLVLDNNILMQRPLDKRLAYFKSHVLEPYKAMMKTASPPPQPFIIEDKSTEFSYGLEKMFKEVIPKVKQLHGNDGLIFTCKNTPYKTGTDEHILKWKPPSDNTVDFLLHITWLTSDPDPQDTDQTPQEDYFAFPERLELYAFYGGDNDYRHFGALFMTPEEWEDVKALQKPLQDCIVECYLEPASPDMNGGHQNPPTNGHNHSNSTHAPRWRFYRIRDDKLQGNHISTVNSVMESIEDQVTEEDLLDAADEIRTAWKKRDAEQRDLTMRRHSVKG